MVVLLRNVTMPLRLRTENFVVRSSQKPHIRIQVHGTYLLKIKNVEDRSIYLRR